MAHICMVTVDHAPNDDRIFEKEAKSLKKAGFDITILCKADQDGKITGMDGKTVLNPSGKLEFEMDDIRIIGIKDNTSLAGRLMHKLHIDRFSQKLIQQGVAINPDVYHAHEPISMYLAMQMRKKTGAKVVLDSHESWMGGTKKEMAIKRLYLKDLKYMITANTITRGHHLCLHPNLKTEVVYNFPDPAVFNIPLDKNKIHDVKIAHDGNLFFNRGLKDMVQLMEKLKSSHPDTTLKIVGEGGKEENSFLQSKINEGLDNIEMTGWINYEDVPKALSDCSIGIILKTRKPINNVLGGPAIKLFNYFASGMAVVDVDLPESTYFLNQTKSGISVQEPTVDYIYEAIIKLIEDKELLKTYCNRSYKAFEKFQWPSEAEKLVNFYHHSILGNHYNIIR